VLVNRQELLDKALELPPDQRAELAGELLQSLEAESDPDAGAAWTNEVRRRVERLDLGLARTVSWPEARDRLRAAARVDEKA
jgi:putative addiction module component (TIGR02574 family)